MMPETVAQQGYLSMREEPFVNATRILAANMWSQLGEYRYEVAIVVHPNSERPVLVAAKRLFNERVGAAWTAVAHTEMISEELRCFQNWAREWMKEHRKNEFFSIADEDFTKILLAQEGSDGDDVFARLRDQHCPGLAIASS